MRAVVCTEVDSALRCEELRTPALRNDEVLVEMVACGVCHTDLHVIRGEVAFPMPAVLGHEVSGVVKAVGAGVDHVAPGAAVVCSFIMPCGRCWYCNRGQEELCETFFAYNRQRGQLYDGTTRLFRPDGSPVWMYSMGGLASLCTVPATAVFPLPDKVPVAESAILGCSLLTAYGALKHAGDVRCGDTVAVTAVGGVGAAIVALARHFGAARIIAVDVRAEQLKHAQLLGATDVINAGRQDATERIRELTGGRGVDVAFEAIGRADTVAATVDAVRDGGRAVLVGIAPAGVATHLEIARLVRRRISIAGSYGGRPRQDMPVLIDLVARGQLDLAPLVTTRYRLDDAPTAYDDLREGRIEGRAIVLNDHHSIS